MTTPQVHRDGGAAEQAAPKFPFPIDNSRTRWVRPITPEQLAAIMADARDDGEPVPDREALWIFLALVVGGAMGWGLIYAAAKLVEIGVEMVR
jgi:hypothetical protein